MKCKTLLILLLISTLSFSQKSGFDFCDQKEIHEHKKSVNSHFSDRSKSNETEALVFFKSNLQQKGTTPKVLPVVVHVIHDGGAENLSSNIIETAIKNLNDAFANVGY